MWRVFRNTNAQPDVQFIVDHPLLISDATADGAPWDMNDGPPDSLSGEALIASTAEQNQQE